MKSLYRIFVILGILIAFTPYAKAIETPLNQVIPLAEKGLATIREKGDKEVALSLLQEAYIRGYDWIDSDAEMELMSQVVSNLLLLRHELRGESMESLMVHLMLKTSIETVGNGAFLFERRPDDMPEVSLENVIDLSEPVSEILSLSISHMSQGNFALAEEILMHLYDRTWRRHIDEDFRYVVANRLVLLYFRLSLHDKAYKLLRQNKLEMDRNGITSKDYVETLVYRGFLYCMQDAAELGNCYLEVAETIANRLSLDREMIMADYVRVMRPENGSDGPLLDFISENDLIFSFISDHDREQRWKAVKSGWEKVKSEILGDDNSNRSMEDCFLAFEYEKQLLLRSSVALRNYFRGSGNGEIVELLDSLRKIESQMTGCLISNEYDEMQASHERIQKELAQHSEIRLSLAAVFPIPSLEALQSKLTDKEAFIDFGQITSDGVVKYYALVIRNSGRRPELIPLCTSDRLLDFLRDTECSGAMQMVEQRYDAPFLYDHIWRPIEPLLSDVETIYYSPVASLNSIMLDAICHDGVYLGENLRFHILSSADAIGQVRSGNDYVPQRMINFCDVDYICD